MRALYLTLILLLPVTLIASGREDVCIDAPVRAIIIGPDVVAAGAANWYSFTQAFVVAPDWSFTSGTGTINSTYSSGNTFYVSVTWTTSGTLYFYDDVSGADGSKNVTVVGTPATTPATRCGTGTVNLSATTGAGGTKVRWYAASSGGSVLSESNSYTTSSISTTTTFYVQTWNHLASVGSARVAVTATVVPIPSAPTSVTGDERCGKGALTLSATADTGTNTVVWYSSRVGGDIVHTGTTFTPTVSAPTAYYAASYHVAAQCPSPTRELAIADAKIIPALTVWSQPILSSGQGELHARLHWLGEPSGRATELVDADHDPERCDVFWYASEEDAEDDVSRLATSFVFTTPEINVTTSYYGKIYDNETGCSSDVTKAVATVIPLVSTASMRTDALRVTGKKTNGSLTSLTDSEKVTTFSYFDGLGRVQQNTVLRGSPSGQDIIIPYEYDALGRASKSYLPYTDTTTTGIFHSGYKLEQQKFFLAANDKIADDSAAYAVSVFEESPRGLVVEQGSIGKGFQPGQGHSSQAEYALNTSADYVRKFDGTGNSSTWHAANSLTKTTGTDAEGNHTLTFTDGSGKTVLVRQWIDTSVEGTYTEYLETYYLYNDLGQLTYIVSPKGTAELKSNSWTFPAIKDSYCNQFKYDDKGRVIEKKVPGQAWQYIVYDPLDRVVLTQEGLLRPDNKWMFIKYDYKGNAIMTGIHTNTTYTTRATLQAYADGIYESGHATFGADTWYEKTGSTAHGYTNVSFPKDNIDVLSVNYFNTYDFDNNGSADTTYVSATLTGEHTPASYTLGRATGSKRKILGTSTWLFTYVFYDNLGRPIQVYNTNPLSTGRMDRTTNAYADDGRVLYSKKFHNAGTGKTKTILNKYEYTARGDLHKISQDNAGTGSVYQLLVQYEYNELGQLVDKKLHHTGSANFLQSVDYRYTIRGQLKSINNSELASNGSNDETTDYFGMELLYNETESGLTTDNRYDGSISAMKWKSVGTASGSTGQKSYAYAYDKTGRLETASYVKKETNWDQEQGAQNETMTYDHDGNIKSMKRREREYGWGTIAPAYTAHTIDSLTYSYASGDKNSLKKIEDLAADTKGFENGSNITTEFRYDVNGNLTSDKNKGIDSIYYNFLGKVTQMDFADHRKILYTYDAAGMKLKQELYRNDSLKTTTHYVNGFVYEAVTNNAPVLSFFGSPEGRVVNNSGTLTYEYSIADHQGNTRVVFTSATPTANTTTVNFESSTNNNVQNYTRTNFELFDHTDVSGSTYTYSQKLTGGTNSQVGISKSMKVYPGDKVKIDAYAKYYNPSGTTSNIAGFAAALTTAFGVSSTSTGEALKAYNTLNNYGGIIAAGGSGGSTSYPKLFVNILLFDKDYNFLDAAWEQIDGGEQVGATPKAAHDLMSKEVTVKEAGYAYVFISNESPTLVEFYVDDVVITHTPTNVIQYNEFYPYGLAASTSWTRENMKDNNYLYNAGNELNKTTGWYEMYYRGYDPAIGRMLQVDPYATMYASSTTYNYALNNPVMMNDPSGGQAYESMNESWRHPSWGSQRTGYGSGNNWSEEIGFADWSLDGASSAGGHFSEFEYTSYMTHPVTGEKYDYTTWRQWEWVPDDNSDCESCQKGCPEGFDCEYDMNTGKIINMRRIEPNENEGVEGGIRLVAKLGKDVVVEGALYYVGGVAFKLVWRGGKWVYQVYRVSKNASVAATEMTTVGRWMSRTEYAAMGNGSPAAVGAGGKTSVTVGGPNVWKAAESGSVYVEFQVPTNSLVPGGGPGIYSILGSNAGKSQMSQLQKLGGQVSPPVQNISQILQVK